MRGGNDFSRRRNKKMNILGIIGFGMNPAACLLRDGKCVAFAEEERFTRIKVSEGLFPGQAISYCLGAANLSLDAIDVIAFGWDCNKYPWSMGRNFAKNFLRYNLSSSSDAHDSKNSSWLLALEGLTDFHPARIIPKINEGFRSIGYKEKLPPIEFIPHHSAHAYSAYFNSGFHNAGILTIDGHGEELCTQLAIGNNDTIRIVESFPIPHSLGWFYAALTEYLGFIPYRDEGKVMGLAAYGQSRNRQNKWIEPLSRILRINGGTYEVDPTYTLFGGHRHGQRFSDKLARLITSIDPAITPVSRGETTVLNHERKNRYLNEGYIDLAWAGQELLERAAVMLASKLVREYNVENICIAGGVGLNCKMNGEILRRCGCKRIFVQPASSDAGSALGAAMFVGLKNGDDVRQPLENAYLGPEFSNADIEKTLKANKLEFRPVQDPAQVGAQLLSEGKIIAWFQGRMEMGPRALGNRSILANPTLPEIKDRVNKTVKFREMWRPFCPSLIDEKKHDYIESPGETRFMTVAYPAKKTIAAALPSVVHVDNSIRPQTVSKQVNSHYHDLLSHMAKLTGHPVVLNTSFNVKGEPIICTPQEAIRCFFSTGLDALILGDFLIEKLTTHEKR